MSSIRCGLRCGNVAKMLQMLTWKNARFSPLNIDNASREIRFNRFLAPNGSYSSAHFLWIRGEPWLILERENLNLFRTATCNIRAKFQRLIHKFSQKSWKNDNRLWTIISECTATSLFCPWLQVYKWFLGLLFRTSEGNLDESNVPVHPETSLYRRYIHDIMYHVLCSLDRSHFKASHYKADILLNAAWYPTLLMTDWP